MVVTIAKATSTDYYTGGSGVADSTESYYLDAVTGGEPPGTWSGKGAQHLGLTGEVGAEDMTSVYTHYINPADGQQIGNKPAQRKPVQERIAAALAAEPDALPERVAQIRERIEGNDRQHVIGWDVTLSVPKSVTVAHTAAHRAEIAALRNGDAERAARFRGIRLGIEGVIQDANRAMLDHAATIATVRTGGGPGAPVKWVKAPGLVISSFFQHTSREIDPQLHIHNVFLNKGFTEDGRALALDGRDLIANRHALGAIEGRVMSEGLARMGFQVELRPDGMARELTIIPTPAMDLFSSRTGQLTARVAELMPAAVERLGRDLTDLEIHRLTQAATKATRKTKGSHAPETTEEMLDRWQAECQTAVASGLEGVADGMLDHLDQRTAPGPQVEPAQWSASAVIAEAVANCEQKRSAWLPSDLMLEIDLVLPVLGDPDSGQDVVKQLTEQALTGPLVRQVSGHLPDTSSDTIVSGLDVAAQLEADPFTPPSQRKYASTGTLAAEEALRRAAIERGGHHLDAADVHAWLDQHTPTIGADQRAAVAGVAASDARLCVLVGPAGTGKSYAAGAFAHAWADLTTTHEAGPGRVVGLAVSQIATQVLTDDGVEHTRNITQWLNAQDRLTEGSTHPGDLEWRVRASDVVMVDEASMVATADLERIQDLARTAGARVVLTGDPRQLGAVEAGGVLGLLDGHAETFTLSEVRRFATDWEPAASLALRDGDSGALAVYDRHGRLTSHDTTADAEHAAARAAVADRLDGRSVVVVAGTNKQAAAIATSVRDQLIELGLVEQDGVMLGRDGCTAGVGDLIAARRNDYGLGVTNRGLYQVTGTGDDGSLTVIPADRDAPTTSPASPAGDVAGGGLVLPAAYVQDDVQLGYASTAHAAQGLTVDAAHLVTDGDLDAEGLYVGLTRGRLRNTAHVGLNTPQDTASAPAASTAGGGQVKLTGDETRASARSVLAGCLDRDTSGRAATVEAELDAERLTSMTQLAGRYEALTRAACRERLDRHLDHLAADGVLDPDTRARLGADEGTEHLSRLLRATEHAGRDPKQVLADAITVRGLGDADSPAQVLSHRITRGQALAMPAPDAGLIPADVAGPAREHLTLLADRITARERVLGERAATNPPAWALTTLGPVPADQTRRAEWEAKAGTVAAHREATGFDNPDQAIGTMPGLAVTERRASHARAWDALGQPQAALDETAMTEGQLRARARAARLEHAWAPPHADAALRAAELAAEQARQDAAIARAAADHAHQLGDLEAAAKYAAQAAADDQQAAIRAAAVGPLTEAANARAVWAAATAVTRDQGAKAEAELTRRGITIGAEPDLTTTRDWLAQHQASTTARDAGLGTGMEAEQHDGAHRADQAAEDDTRIITETDLIDPAAARTAIAAEQEPSPAASAGNSRQHDLTRAEEAGTATDAARPGPAAQRHDPGTQEMGWGQGKGRPAHQQLPEDVTAAEIEAAAATAALTMARARDRASQDASHVEPADLDDTTAADQRHESYDAGRRRRDAADASTSAASGLHADSGLEASHG